MNIEIYFSDSKDGFLLKDDAPKGVSVSPKLIPAGKGLGSTEPLNMIIYFALGVSSQVIASWLYDKLKKCSSNKITIDRKEIILDEGEITRIIEEKITKG